MKRTLFIFLLMFTILCCGCVPDTPAPTATPEPDPELTLPEGLPDMNSIIPSEHSSAINSGAIEPDNTYKTESGDYTMSWWPDGFTGKRRAVFMRTGHYGLSLDSTQGGVRRLGYLDDGLSYEEAAEADCNPAIMDLPALKMDYAVISNGTHRFKRFNAVYRAAGMDVYNRMYECGRYMQHHDLMEMVFDGIGAPGHVEVFVMPGYLSLGFGIYPATVLRQVGFTFSLTFEQDITFEENRDGSVVCVRFADGSGYSFVSTGSDISVNGNTVTVSGTVGKCAENTFSGISVLIVPSKQACLAEGEAVYAARNLECTATVNDKATPAFYDANGYLLVYERSLKVQDVAAPQTLFENDFNRSVIRVSNPTDQTVRVPMQFFTPTIASHQQCPVIRDLQTGQPVGLSVQSSVNFHAHEGLEESSPRNYYTGKWLRYYTMLTLTPGQVLEFEYLSIPAQWGGVSAICEQQISLAGWGGYQQWDHTTGAGCVCYDIARAWNGCNMADAYPLLAATDDKTGWDYNVGGGDFLFYYNEKGTKVALAQMKTLYRKQGPNLVEFTYSGYTADGKVKVEITIYVGRDDSVVRNIHKFKYTFLEDVAYKRLALYQCGGDSYTYSRWTKGAVGNRTGVTGLTLADGTELSGEFDLPAKGYNNYVTDAHGVELGKGAWAALIRPNDNQGTGCSDRVMAVFEFSADVDGTHYDTPAISMRSTNINGDSCIYELNMPVAAGSTVPKGSVVEGSVGYILIPSFQSNYCGNSKVMASIPAEMYGSAEMAYLFATQSATTVSASVGTVVSNYPAQVNAPDDARGIMAQFTLCGGIGYVPVTIGNLPSCSGYMLQKNCGGQWLDVDQSVMGNDYWQAYYDAAADRYELTYNVEHTGRNEKCEYRLIKV